MRTTLKSLKGKELTLISPLPNSVVTNPIKIAGIITGSFFFEGSFPANILNASNEMIGKGLVKAGGNAMTASPVHFSALISFTTTPDATGTVVLKNDNPSGEPENDDSVSIPVRFK